jgi:Ca2+-binding RTX toxin-like protein
MNGNTPSTVEALEGRTLFANAHIFLDTLIVRGDRGAQNNMVVADSSDGQSVNVNITSVTKRGVTKNFETSFPKSVGFTGITIRGGQQADVITVGSEADPLEMDVRVNGFAGDDTITGSAGNDLLIGGLGNDTIRGGNGNDTVRGGKGDDHLFGEVGDDIIWGALGNDEVDGGIGNDKLGGILGNNKMTGGEGQDEFLVRSLEANPENDFTDGADILTIRVKREDPDPVV